MSKYKNQKIVIDNKEIINFDEYIHARYMLEKEQDEKDQLIANPELTKYKSFYSFDIWWIQNKRKMENSWDAYVARVEAAYRQAEQNKKPLSNRIVEYILKLINKISPF